jgi:hypothetical protein
VIEGAGFFDRKGQNFFDSWGIRKVPSACNWCSYSWCSLVPSGAWWRGFWQVTCHLCFWTQTLVVRANTKLFLELQTDGIKVESKTPEDRDSGALSKPDYPEEQVFRRHEVVVKPARFLTRKVQRLLSRW